MCIGAFRGKKGCLQQLFVRNVPSNTTKSFSNFPDSMLDFERSKLGVWDFVQQTQPHTPHPTPLIALLAHWQLGGFYITETNRYVCARMI